MRPRDFLTGRWAMVSTFYVKHRTILLFTMSQSVEGQQRALPPNSGQIILEVGHPGITCEQPISCAHFAWLHSSTWEGSSGWSDMNSVQIRHFSNRAVKQTHRN